MLHKYPKDLADSLELLWPQVEGGAGLDGAVHALPPNEVLSVFISTGYQVSQMQEESRELRFRMMLCDPHVFGEEDVHKSYSLFVLEFDEKRPYNEYELMKLGPSVAFYDSLIGVSYSEVEGLQIWGMIHSGDSWTHMIHGGSQISAPLPPCLVLNVVGPGRVTACHGYNILVQLTGGAIITPSDNVFQSNWVKDRLHKMYEGLFARHRKNLHYSPETWAKINPDFVAALYQEYIKQLISSIRRSGHGGMIITMPADNEEEVFAEETSLVSVKYRFQEGDERYRLKNIFLEIMESLAKICGRLYGPDYEAGWSDYVSLRDEGLAHLDEQVLEYARFVAKLAAVDGAVITTEEPEVIGFGGIVQGTYQMGQSVAQSVDPEGSQKQIERIEGVGTRHRALYYLCSRMQDVIGIVISQDGKVRAVSWNNNIVTCWDIIPIDFI